MGTRDWTYWKISTNGGGMVFIMGLFVFAFFLLFYLSGFSIIDYPFGFSNVYLMPLSTKFQIYRGFSSLLADETGAPGENHRPVI